MSAFLCQHPIVGAWAVAWLGFLVGVVCTSLLALLPDAPVKSDRGGRA